MRKVTDPKLLAKLNGTSVSENTSAPSNLRPVTDPELLSKLNNKSSSELIPSESWFNTNLAAEPSIPNWEQLKQAAIQTKDIGEGAAQGLYNSITKTINIVKKKPLLLADFALSTPAGKLGEIGGEVGSFFLPSGTLSKGADLLKLRPAINAFKAKGIGGATVAVGKNALNTGILEAQNNPKNALTSFEKGGEQGALSQLAINALTSKAPIIKSLGHALAGYLGYEAGKTIGHPELGGAAGAFAPSVLRALTGGTKNSIAENALSGLESKDVEKSVLANRRLGTYVTPAQASGNAPKASQEAELKRSVEGAQTGSELEKGQKESERKSIQDFMDKIYKPNPKNEKAISDAYDKAHKININPKLIPTMRDNPVLDEAFSSVEKLPAFKNIPQNNYEYLAQVERTLGRMYDGKRLNDPNSAYIIKEIKKGYSKFLEDVNPDYLNAKNLAQPRIVRHNIEEALNKHEEDYTAKNFYSKFLNTRKSTANLLRDVRNFPEARKAIQDMREGWKNLSNMKTVSQAAGQSESGISQARDQGKAIIQAMKKYLGAKDDKKALEYIHDKEMKWLDDIDRLAKIPHQKERNRRLLTLIGGIAESAGLNHRDYEE